MNAPAKTLPSRATLADVEAAPANKVAELVGGVLHVMGRPAPRHLNAEAGLVGELRGPFHRGRGGPGGWRILAEPELHFPDPTALDAIDVLSPDVAGWRLERLPGLPKEAFFALAPDWICEVLSPSTETFDREEKMPIYAREGVRHAWLVDPIEQVLEVYLLGPRRRWGKASKHRGAVQVRVPPFDAIDLDLASLWDEAAALPSPARVVSPKASSSVARRAKPKKAARR